MDSIGFSIKGIENGWLFTELSCGNTKLLVETSYLGGLGAPAVLLKNVTRMVRREQSSCWLCWHGENDSKIWKMSCRGDELSLGIREGKSSVGLPLEGELLSKAALDHVLLEVNTSLYLFAQALCEEFQNYRRGAELVRYEAGGFLFPHKELKELKSSLKGISA